MTSEDRFPNPVEALIVVLGSFFVLIFLIAIYGAITGATQPVEMMDNARAIYIFGGAIFLIVPLLYSKIRGYSIVRVFRLKSIPPAMIWLSLLNGLALTIVGDELDRLVQLVVKAPEWLEEIMLPLKAQTSGEWLQILFGAVFIAAISEEFLFRGFLQISLEKKGDVTRAVLLTSIAWTLIHQNPYWAVQIFVVGVFIGFVAWRADSILPTILIHGVYNFIGVLFVNYGESPSLQFYEWKGHVNPFILLLGGALLFWTIKKMNQLYWTGP